MTSCGGESKILRETKKKIRFCSLARYFYPPIRMNTFHYSVPFARVCEFSFLHLNNVPALSFVYFCANRDVYYSRKTKTKRNNTVDFMFSCLSSNPCLEKGNIFHLFYNFFRVSAKVTLLKTANSERLAYTVHTGTTHVYVIRQCSCAKEPRSQLSVWLGGMVLFYFRNPFGLSILIGDSHAATTIRVVVCVATRNRISMLILLIVRFFVAVLLAALLYLCIYYKCL